MSAPALNIAAPPTPGASAGIGSSASAAQSQAANDPMAGFEAVLATLFGLKDAAGLPTDASKAAGKSSGPAADAAKPDDNGDSDTKPADTSDVPTVTAPDATLALLTPAIAIPLAAPMATTVTSGAQSAAAGASAVLTGPGDKSPLPTPETGVASAEDLAKDQDNGRKSALADVAQPPALEQQAAALKPAIAPPATAIAPPAETPATPSTTVLALQTQPPAAAIIPPTATPIAPEAPPAPVAASKDKPAVGKPVPRVEANRPAGVADLAAGQVQDAAAAPSLAEAGTTTADDKGSQGPFSEAKADAADAPARQSDVNTVTETTTTPAALTHPATIAVRGSPQTVANLAAQIVKKLEGRSTQFDVQLDPAGLGRVDVKVAIGADGRISAAMSFDSPQAAADVKSRANELHAALQQAGFDISGGLSFDVAGGGGQGQGQGGQDQSRTSAPVFRSQAFQTALETLGDSVAAQGLTLRSTTPSGVDIRI